MERGQRRTSALAACAFLLLTTRCGGDDPSLGAQPSDDAGVTTNDGDGASDGGGADVDTSNWKLKKIGTPSWRPVDLHVLHGVVDSCAAFAMDVCSEIFAGKHRGMQGVCRPGVDHAAPFTKELRDALVAAQIPDATTLTTRDFTSPGGVYLAFMLVADAPISAPITMNQVQLVDAPPTRIFRPAELPDRVTHAPVFVQVAGIDKAGTWSETLGLRDANGFGWDITFSLDVTDAPSQSTSCTDTRHDPLNCGSCGHDCKGGICVRGQCQAHTVTSLPGFLAHLAADDSAAYVGITPSFGEREVRRYPHDGGAMSVVTTEGGGPLALSGSDLFFNRSVGLSKVPSGGGSATTLVSGKAASRTNIARNASHVFFGTGDSGYPLELAMHDVAGATTSYAPIDQRTMSIAADEAFVYYANGTKLMRNAGDGSASAVIASDIDDASPLDVFGGQVYTVLFPKWETARLVRIDPSNGNVTTLATIELGDHHGFGPAYSTVVRATSTDVFFTVIPRYPTACMDLWRTAPDGSGLRRVATTSITELAVTKDYLVWSRSGSAPSDTGGGTDGALYRLVR